MPFVGSKRCRSRNAWAADADQASKDGTSGSFLIDVERPGVVLLGELNDFGLGDKVGPSLAANTNFKIFKISAGQRGNPTSHGLIEIDSHRIAEAIPL